jgi:CO/xanthine dehydrogenase Mo-binding subunit
MTDIQQNGFELDRSGFLKATGAAGALVVWFGLPGAARAASTAAGPYPDLDPAQLDSWIAIGADNTATLFTGKNDLGQGLGVAFRQIVAEELDMDYSQLKSIHSDTKYVTDQGGASGSTGVANGGIAVRNAAATARQALVDLASKKLGVPASGLVVDKGVVTGGGSSVKYGELVGGKQLSVTMSWNGQTGNGLNVALTAKTKDPASYRVVGKSIPRDDIPHKVFGKFTWPGDLKINGMLHARIVRPSLAGATIKSVDGFAKKMPGIVRVLPIADQYVAVLAEREEQAIAGSRELKITWNKPATPPFTTQAGVYDYIRNAKPRNDVLASNVGNFDAGIAGAAKTIEAEYLWPFQSHASMAPAVALANYNPADGTIVVWSGTQKTAAVRRGVAGLLGLDPAKVRVIFVQGPGSYGRNDADDAALEAAWLSKQVGKPVRLQWMRHEGTGWDPKGPATIITVKGGVDAKGAPIGWDYTWKGFSGQEVGTSGDNPADTLIGMAFGLQRPQRNVTGTPSESYGFPHKRVRTQVVEAFMPMNNPLRSSHIRDPQGPQSTFAAESFADELAVAGGMDSVAFRLKYLTNPRHAGVVDAAAKAYGWDTRVSGTKVNKNANILTGRGVAMADRGPTYVAIVSEVEVNRKTGKVWVKRAVVAADAGLIINPAGFKLVMEASFIQSMSRTMKEEIRFSPTKVESVSWETYPIANTNDVPGKIDVVTVNNSPGFAPGAAGEPSIKVVGASIANAIFDATGVRYRQVPLTPARIKAGLRAAGL